MLLYKIIKCEQLCHWPLGLFWNTLFSTHTSCNVMKNIATVCVLKNK